MCKLALNPSWEGFHFFFAIYLNRSLLPWLKFFRVSNNSIIFEKFYFFKMFFKRFRSTKYLKLTINSKIVETKKLKQNLNKSWKKFFLGQKLKFRLSRKFSNGLNNLPVCLWREIVLNQRKFILKSVSNSDVTKPLFSHIDYIESKIPIFWN